MVTSVHVGISWRPRLIVVLAQRPSGSGNRRPAPVWRGKTAHVRPCAELDPSLINLAMPVGHMLPRNHDENEARATTRDPEECGIPPVMNVARTLMVDIQAGPQRGALALEQRSDGRSDQSAKDSE